MKIPPGREGIAVAASMLAVALTLVAVGTLVFQ
jgi:hypothetical protein